MNQDDPSGYAEFFDQKLIPGALNLLLQAWSQITKPDPLEKEDKITERLAALMKRDKTSRKMPFSIHFQVTPLDGQGAVAARIDFSLLSGYNEDAYLAFECKRLRILHESGLGYNTDDYVGPEGMGRFAAGKYAPTQTHGVMVGYVMDGKVINAMKSVLARIKREKQSFGYTGEEWEASIFLPEESCIRQTKHDFHQPTPKTFFFQHVFLAV